MPKPIKKRPEKTTRPDEDGMNYVESVRNAYAKNQQAIQKAVLVIVVVVIAIAAVFFYMKRTSGKLTELNYQGYKAYTQALKTNDSALMNEALEKFKESYKQRKSAYALYYQADIQLRAGDNDAVIKTLTDLVREFSSDEYILPLAYAKLGTIYLSQGDNENALKTFKEMESKDLPVYGDLALYYQSTIQRKMGNEEEANRAAEILVQNFPESPYAKELKPQLEARNKENTKKIEKKEKEVSEKKEK